MINLLPQEEKDKLFLRRVKNLSIILGSVVVISLICYIFILLSIKFYIMAEIENQKFILETTEMQYKSENTEDIKDAIQYYNDLLPKIQSFYKNQIYLSKILAEISQIQRPSGLYFNGILISAPDAKGIVKVNILGVSDTRENLISFQKSLQSQNTIKTVLFSADSWINPTNANFNLTLEYGN